MVISQYCFFSDSFLSIGTDEECLSLRMYFDKAINVYGNRIGAVLISSTSAHFPVAMQFRLLNENNTTEL